MADLHLSYVLVMGIDQLYNFVVTINLSINYKFVLRRKNDIYSKLLYFKVCGSVEGMPSTLLMMASQTSLLPSRTS